MGRKRFAFGLGGIGLVVIIAVSIYFIGTSDDQDVTSTNPIKELSTPQEVEASEKIDVIATLENVKGDVLVRKSEDEEVKAENGMKLGRGWQVTTAEQSSVELTFTTEMRTVLSENTQIIIGETDENETSDSIRLKHINGTIWNAGQHEDYVVQTPDMSLKALGTHFIVSYDSDKQQSTISVFSGLVGASGNQDSGEGTGMSGSPGNKDIADEMVVIPPSLQLKSNSSDSSVERGSFQGEIDNISDLIDAIKMDPDLGFTLSPIDPDSLIDMLTKDILEALFESKAQVDVENAELLAQLKGGLLNDSSFDYEALRDSLVVSDFETRLTDLLENIAKSAVEKGKLTPEDIERLIGERNSEVDREVERNQERQDDRRQAEEEEQSQEELDRQKKQEIRNRLRQEELERRNRERREELERQQQENFEKLEEERRKQEAERKKRDEERRKQEEERRKQEEERRKQEEEKNNVQPQPEIPKSAPKKLDFYDTDPLTGKLAGEVKITKAEDEANITQYILYWANSNKQKLSKITAFNKTGKDITYTFTKNTPIPKNATGLIAVSANEAGESKNYAYVEINDYQAMTLKNPLSDQEIFTLEQKHISLDKVFKDVFGKWIQPMNPDYELEITSSDEEVAWIDSGFNIIGNKAGTVKITVTVTNRDNDESISDSFTVEVKETGITGNINLTSLLPEEGFDFKVHLFAHNQEQDTTYETKVELDKGQDKVPFNLILPRGTYTITYGLIDDGRYLEDGQSVFLYHSGEVIDVAAEKEQLNLKLPVMEGIEVVANHDGFELGFGENNYVKYQVFVNDTLYTSQDNFIAIDGLETETTYKVRVDAYSEEISNVLGAIWFGTVTTAKEPEKQPEVPKFAPEKITFKDTDPLAGKLTGEVKIAKATDETDITAYTLYWANSKQEKLAKITSLDSTGEDRIYTFPENTNIPEGATGLLAFSVNEVGESQHFAYVEIDDYQAMSVKNPISDHVLFLYENRHLDLENVFVDPFGTFIPSFGESSYEITIQSSNENVVYAYQDGGYHIRNEGQLGEAIVTLTVINRENQDSISHSFKVVVKEPKQGAGVSGNVRLTSLLPEEDFDFKVTLNWVYIDDRTSVYTEIDLVQGEHKTSFDKPLKPGKYDLRSYTLSSELWGTHIIFYDPGETTVIETEDQHELLDDLIIPVMDGVAIETFDNGFELDFGSNAYAKYDIFVNGVEYSSSDNLFAIDGLEPETTYKVSVHAEEGIGGPKAVWFGTVTTERQEKEPKSPENAPQNITFTDTDPLAGKLAGEVKITKAADETDISAYVLYWMNSKQEKLAEITSMDSTGEDKKYTFPENTSIPEKATGLLAVSANEVGESENFVYIELDDYQAISVKNPISDQMLFLRETKYLELENVFVDPFDEFIPPFGESPYEITIQSSNENIVYAYQDGGYHIRSEGELGEATITITVKNVEIQESITHSFKVQVKEP